MKKVTIRESQAPYTLALDDETLADETVVLEREGRPVAALLPIAGYEAFRAWQQTEAQQQRRQRQREAFERERAAFERMKPELSGTHPGKVVAIFEGQIVEVGTDIAETLDRVYDRSGYVPCYVQRIEETHRVSKVPHRIVSREAR